MAVIKKMDSRSTAGLGSRRRTFQTTMLIDLILRAGDSANEPVSPTRLIQSEYWNHY